MKHFTVFGNPIKHSQSPYIHQLFARQTGIALGYTPLLVPQDAFELTVQAFFAGGGTGANVTLPFKERACQICSQLTERASAAGAVNTLMIKEHGELLGDNTDGVGLLYDLRRLLMIRPGARILLLGAGGAARGVIQPLLQAECRIVIANRTLERARQLAVQFASADRVTAQSFSELDREHFDLIINATSSSVEGKIPVIPVSLIRAETHCYDLFYAPQQTPFLQWAQQQGACSVADGLGMLVAQAAYAFQLWHGVLPEIEPVLAQLRSQKEP